MNRINIQELLDFDYLDKLSDKDKIYLSKFCTEFYSADFRGEKPLHKSKKKKREIYNNNNARNRDTTALLGAYKMLDGLDKAPSISENTEALDELVDLMKKLSKKI